MGYRSRDFVEAYSAMSDSELIRLQLDEGALIPEALHALHNEMGKRRLAVAVAQPQRDDQIETSVVRPPKRMGWLTTAFLVFVCASVLTRFLSGYLEARERSRRIREILQEARSNEAADSRIKAEFQEITSRQTASFAEFEQQCRDLQAVRTESDAMDRKKRKMLDELQYGFRDDAKMQPMFSTLRELENLSDKEGPIWNDMIACADRLTSADKRTQAAYQLICIDPANRRLESLAPEYRPLILQLQTEFKQTRGSLPPELLQALGH